MDKREQLKNRIFKLLCNHPYSIVRREVDKLGRQIRELDNRAFIKNSEENA